MPTAANILTLKLPCSLGSTFHIRKDLEKPCKHSPAIRVNDQRIVNAPVCLKTWHTYLSLLSSKPRYYHQVPLVTCSVKVDLLPSSERLISPSPPPKPSFLRCRHFPPCREHERLIFFTPQGLKEHAAFILSVPFPSHSSFPQHKSTNCRRYR